MNNIQKASTQFEGVEGKDYSIIYDYDGNLVKYFEIEVNNVNSIEEAKAKARENINSFEVLDEYTSEWDFNDWKEIKDEY